jgi:hypothetical protein
MIMVAVVGSEPTPPSLPGAAVPQNYRNLGNQSWNVVYRTQRSRQNQGQTATEFLVAEYGCNHSDFIKNCKKCQKNPTDVHPKPDLLTPLPICAEPNQRIHADLFGALVTS